MNTPAHLIFAAAAFARPDRRGINAAAVAGGLLPDVPLFLLVGWALYVQGIAPQVVFGQMYFSDGWQAVFAIDHSLPLWSLALILWRRFRGRTARVLIAMGMVAELTPAVMFALMFGGA